MSTDESPAAPSAPSSANEKVTLFRRLFVGRDDVYATRWENAAKSGYSPACHSDRVPGVCGKPQIKCTACPNQAFRLVTDREIRGHLQGLQVIGLYPLLRDNTCRLVAADFDGDGWEADVAAFAKAGRALDVGVAVERSRSGKGAHAWIFFDAPIAASVARLLGFLLLEQARAMRPQLRSFDRLFPNQDTLPPGGFGNLIALPLQLAARQRGNSVFVDEALSEVPDQWAYLASVHRVTPRHASDLTGDATTPTKKRSRPVPSAAKIVRSTSKGGGHGQELLFRDTSAVVAPEVARGAVATISVTLSEGVTLGKRGLPAGVLQAVRRLAVFHNPEFYKRQKSKRSTWNVPRLFFRYQETTDAIRVPRGCREEVIALLSESGSGVTLCDERADGHDLDVDFVGRLSPAQNEAELAILAHDTGVLVAPPGFGKTIVAARVIAVRKARTLVLVHTKALLSQWIERLSAFLELRGAKVGKIGGGVDDPTGLVDVATFQSLIRRGEIAERIAGYGHVIVDECHHVPAANLQRVLAASRARHVLGLTATPQRRDGHEPLLKMQCGPVRHRVSAKEGAQRDLLGRVLHRRVTPLRVADVAAPGEIHDVYAAIAEHRPRNELIVDDVCRALLAGRSPLVLTERRGHLGILAAMLRERVSDVVVLHGGRRAADDRASREALAAPGWDRVIVATGRFAGEGFDHAQLDTLFLTMPVSWKGTLVQYTGRLHRGHVGKREAWVVDYVDDDVPMARSMFETRERGYGGIGYVESSVPFEEVPSISRTFLDDGWEEPAGEDDEL